MENIKKLLLNIPENSLNGYRLSYDGHIFIIKGINSNADLYVCAEGVDQEEDYSFDLDTGEIQDKDIEDLIKYINFNIIKV